MSRSSFKVKIQICRSNHKL